MISSRSTTGSGTNPTKGAVLVDIRVELYSCTVIPYFHHIEGT